MQAGCLLWANCVVIPPAGQDEVLRELHVAHPSSSQMKRLARAFTWSPGMDKAIETLVGQCRVCQSEQPIPPSFPLLPIRWPTHPWSHIHVDLAGPFMGRMFLVLIDAHSKCMEVHTLTSCTSASTTLFLRNIFAAFGLPEVLVSDNGLSFSGAEFNTFLRNNGIKHKLTVPYHPASNGLAERAVKTFMQGMRKQETGSIEEKLARFLFSYGRTPHVPLAYHQQSCSLGVS